MTALDLTSLGSGAKRGLWHGGVCVAQEQSLDNTDLFPRLLWHFKRQVAVCSLTTRDWARCLTKDKLSAIPHNLLERDALGCSALQALMLHRLVRLYELCGHVQ